MLRLGGLTTVRGRVLGLEPDELSRARVSIRTSGNYLGSSVDWQGRFAIERVPSGQWPLVGTLELSGGRLTAETEVLIEPNTREVVADLEFERDCQEAALSGRVSIDGKPASAWLLLSDGSDYWNTTANSLGEFQFPAMSPGTYDLTIAAKDAALTHARIVEVFGEEWINLRLDRAVVTGRVSDAAGRPVAGAVLEVLGYSEPLGKRYTRHRSSDDGSFRIDALLEGSMRLVASRDRYATWTGDIVAGEQVLEIVLESGGPAGASDGLP